MKSVKFTLVLCLFAALCHATIQSSVVWEAQSGGSASNGGGFDSALSGTDAGGTPVSYTDIHTSATATGVATATYTSGITATGATGTTCIVQTLNNSSSGAMLLIALTGTNTIAGGTSFTIVRAGNGATSAPTSGTASTGTATSCSGTATISTTLGVTEATSAGHAFSTSTNGPGNIINIVSGTDCVVARAEIISVSGSTATFDKAIQTANVGTQRDCTGTLGGYFVAATDIVSNMVAGNIGYIKGTLATTSVGFTWSTTCTGTTLSIPVGGQCQLIGYTSTRGDGGQGIITNSGNIATVITDSGAWHVYKNITVDGGGSGKGQTMLNDSTGTPILIVNSIFKNFVTRGVNAQTNGLFMRGVGITGGVSGCTSAFQSLGRNTIYGAEIYSNPCPAVVTATTGGLMIFNSIIHDNSGASSDGIQLGVAAVGSAPQIFQGNVIYNNGRDGFRATVINGFDNTQFYNNIIAQNAGVGINSTVNSYAGQSTFITGSSPIASDYNVHLFNGGDTGTTTTHNLTGFSYGPHDFCANTSSGCATAITVNPFTTPASPTFDFSINNTANGGTVIRGAAFPGLFSGATTTGYLTPGAAQVQATGGGGTGQVSFSLTQ